MKVLHLGYYNDIEDINLLKSDKAENIIPYMKLGFGKFYTLNEMDDIEVDSNDNISFYDNFIVVKDINDSTNSFIDIFDINAGDKAKIMFDKLIYMSN